jgi:hypothetical protein
MNRDFPLETKMSLRGEKRRGNPEVLSHRILHPGLLRQASQ